MALRRFLLTDPDEMASELAEMDPLERAQLTAATDTLNRLIATQPTRDPPLQSLIQQWMLRTPSDLVAHLATQSIPFMYRILQELTDTSQVGVILRRILLFNLFSVLVRDGHHDHNGFIYGRRKRVVMIIEKTRTLSDDRIGDNLSRFAEQGQSYAEWVQRFNGLTETLFLLPVDLHEDSYRKAVNKATVAEYLLGIGVVDHASILHNTRQSTVDVIKESVELQQELRHGIPMQIPDSSVYPFSADYILWFRTVQRDQAI